MADQTCERCGGTGDMIRNGHRVDCDGCNGAGAVNVGSDEAAGSDVLATPTRNLSSPLPSHIARRRFHAGLDF